MASERRESYNGQGSVYTEGGGDRRTDSQQRKHFYPTTPSSICPITSLIHTSISSLASSPCRSPFLPFFLSDNSSSHRAHQVFHSLTSRFMWAMGYTPMFVSSAASSSSNTRRFRWIWCCCPFVRSVRGQGRQRNYLNRSRICFWSSRPP